MKNSEVRSLLQDLARFELATSQSIPHCADHSTLILLIQALKAGSHYSANLLRHATDSRIVIY